LDNSPALNHRQLLIKIARRAMLERGLAVDFPAQVMAEINHINEVRTVPDTSVIDLKYLPWCSIDNDSSEDLDQITAAEAQKDGSVKVFVAIADVDTIASKNTPLDGFAAVNTLSVYTPAVIFPMLPEKLSTDLTSLKLGRERYAMVMEMTIAPSGETTSGNVYRALVINKAKLAYNSTALWLDGKAPVPQNTASVAGLAENIRLQAETAKKMKALRHLNGALSLDTFEANPIFHGDEISEIEAEKQNTAKAIIELISTDTRLLDNVFRIMIVLCQPLCKVIGGANVRPDRILKPNGFG